MPVIDLEITFGKCGFSVSDNTATLPVFVDRNKIPKIGGMKVSDGQVVFGDRHFCEKRLKGRMMATPEGGESPGQGHLPGTTEEIEGNFDAKSFRVTPDELAFSAKFCRDDMDISADDLLGLEGRSGRLIVDEILSVPVKPKKSKDKNGDDDDHPDLGPINRGNLKAGGAQLFGRDVGGACSLSDLIAFSRDDARLTPAMIKLVATAVDGETVGHLEAMCRKWPEGWVKKIPGMGKDKITRLTDALEAFRKANPIPDDDQKPTMAEDEAAENAEAEAESFSEPEDSGAVPWEETRSPYKQGREARIDGTAKDQNPFKGQNKDHAREWLDGWKDQDRIETGEQLDDPKSHGGTIFDEANA